MTSNTLFKSRSISISFLASEQSEGRGARVRRTIGRSELRSLDPFLLLDEFKVGLPGGFPDHPHRGFSTVTYLLPSSKGSFRHEDFMKHGGTIGPGGVQWMTAGRGIVHSEMPSNKDQAHGLQLWINLPKTKKMMSPKYQELSASEIPTTTKDGITATVIAGTALGITSPIRTEVPVHYSHFEMKKDSKLQHDIPTTFNTFLYALDGNGSIGGKVVEAHYVITLNQDGNGVEVVSGKDGFTFVIVSGEPIHETVVQHGPFVMNTQQEIQQAMRDYSMGTNGFENAPQWIEDREQ